jgi:hypothetical protein
MPRKRPEKYNIKPIEPRGITAVENKPMKSFWKEYSMDQVITMTPEELDKEIDASLERFRERQLMWNKNWHWPDQPKYKG